MLHCSISFYMLYILFKPGRLIVISYQIDHPGKFLVNLESSISISILYIKKIVSFDSILLAFSPSKIILNFQYK